MPVELIGFLGVAVLVIVTPGPDTALTIRNTLLGGRTGGIATALGVVSGQAVWALATSLGVVALLLASEPAFAAVRLAGAAYLVFLGAQTLVAAWRGGSWEGGAQDGRRKRKRLRPRTAARQGLISNLGNPKMAAFFPSLLPQFVPAGEAAFAPLLFLGLLFCTMTLVWLTAYALVVSRARGFLRRTGVKRALEALTGTVLVALGLRLAVER
jgi:threonine/homoserine/homoserine lactone efflux protein